MPDAMNNASEPEGNLNEAIAHIFQLAKRGRWWIMTAGCCIPVVVAAVALKLPNTYVSKATLLIQQDVSQRYVDPDNATSIQSGIKALEFEVLSSGRLLSIIKDFDLYAADKDRLAPELMVGNLRKDIEIEALETTSSGRTEFNGLTIAFSASTPQLAQAVTSRLTSLFIEENSKTRGKRAANTAQFLSDQVDAAKQRLAEQERLLQAFKSSNLGELPEQQSVNLAALMDLRTRLNAVALNLAQAKNQQALIESSFNERLARLESSLSERLKALQTERAQLLLHYTPRYPEVIEKDNEIAKVQAMLDHVKEGATGLVKMQDESSPDVVALLGIAKQADANRAEIESLSKQQQQLTAEAAQYQTRLNLTPVREQQLAALLRDYDLFKQDYTNLLNKKIESQLTVNLEENQQGQQFRLVDPPTLPLKASGPSRAKICLGGMAGGVAVGVALAFLMAMRDTSFHAEKALGRMFPVPLLCAVPLVLTRIEVRARRRNVAIEWLAGSLMTLVMLAAQVYVLRSR